MAAFDGFKASHPGVVLIALFTQLAVAAEFAGGTGEPNDPFQIATAEQLIAIGSDPNLLDKNFILVADIDLDPNLPGGRVFTKAIIAADVPRKTYFGTVLDPSPFNGNFDGKGHAVTNLVIDAATAHHVGLFGTIGASGRVQDLGVEGVSVRGSYGVGGLAGHNGGTILRCHSFGQVSGSQYVGGLAGGNVGVIAMSCTGGAVFGADRSYNLGGLGGQNYNGIITGCRSDTAVHARYDVSYVGGLVGNNAGCISDCYATGPISAGDSSMFVGGLAGYNMDSIVNCYTNGSVLAGYGSTCIGGFVGNNPGGTVANCYATGFVSAGSSSKNVGGFLGHAISAGDVIHCFWDVEASGISSSGSGVGLTTSEMQDMARYMTAGWDWVGERANGTADLWLIPQAGGYPELAVFHDEGTQLALKGSGTHNDPYRIGSVEDVGAMSRYDPSACYRLEADLDMSGIVWTTAPIAGLDGGFDGGSHVVSNLTIRGGGFVGLFGMLTTRATVAGVTVQDANVASIGPVYCSGILAGDSRGNIIDCHATGVVAGWNSVGGLVGANHWGRIVNSHAAVDVLSGGTYACGGFAGVNAGDITRCFAAGIVSGAKDVQKVGGFVGYNTHLGDITDSYARGNISAGEDSYCLGGFVGHNEYLGRLVNCYTTGSVSGGRGSRNLGSFIGKNEVGTSSRGPAIVENPVSNCYFLRALDAAESADSTGWPLTDERMKMQSSFVNWDFETVWMICEGKDYPRLQWEQVQCEP